MNLFDVRQEELLSWMNEPPEWRFYSDRSLFIHTPSHTDFFADPSGTLPITSAPLLCTTAPNRFELSTQVRVENAQTSDSAGLFIGIDSDNWAKLFVEYEDDVPHIVSVVTRHGLSDEGVSQRIAVSDPHLRISALGSAFIFTFSETSKEWKRVRYFSFGMKPDNWVVGVTAASPEGKGCEATFESLVLKSLD